MRIALQLAEQSQLNGDVPFGAVIVKNRCVLAAIGNSEHADQNVTRHAEVKAVSAASTLTGTRNLTGCTIYSTVEPCPMCAGAIFHACIDRVVYGMSRDDLPHLFRSRAIRLWDLAQDWHYNPQITGGVLKDEAIAAFSNYNDAFRVAHTHQDEESQPSGFFSTLALQ